VNEEYKSVYDLVEESQDLQSDAIRSSRDSLDELVAHGHDLRRGRDIDLDESRQSAAAHRSAVSKGMIGGGILAGAAIGTALIGLVGSAAFASTPTDIQMLQTSASIENLAVQTYKTALTLPYIGGSAANPVIKAFATTTMGQHTQHAMAFNSAITALGGMAQTNPDPKYVPTVNAAVAAITKDSPSDGALAVVGLALTLENVAAQTYVSNCSKYSDTNAKKITASIMGVEAQHVATLYAVQALLKANAPQLINLSPTVVAQLPGAAGSVGFPNSFYPVSLASPATEGALS
jgi:Ferritin-like domain